METTSPDLYRENQALPAVGTEQLRRALRRRAAGVTIVTTCRSGVVHGMTATAVTGVCLEPPLLLVCLAKKSRTHRLVGESGLFAVNLLGQEQRALAERFAGGEDPQYRFRGIPCFQAVTGAPILDGCLGYFDCRVTAAHDGGDHTIFVGQVCAAGTPTNGNP